MVNERIVCLKKNSFSFSFRLSVALLLQYVRVSPASRYVGGAIGPRLGTVDLKTNVSGWLQTFWIGTLIGVLQVGFSAIHRWKRSERARDVNHDSACRHVDRFICCSPFGCGLSLVFVWKF